MSSTTPIAPLAWSTIAARGLKTKVPEPMRIISEEGTRERLVSNVLYEDEDIKTHLMAQKVYSVLQNTLSPNSVLFSFPGNLFEHRTAAYKLVLDQIGPVVGDVFNPVSMFGNRLKNELLFSAVFRDSDNMKLAIEEGVTHNNIHYRGTPYKDGVKSHLVRVHMHLHVAEEKDVLVKKVIESMSNYGKVCDIKKYTMRGFFEGQLSVLLDITETKVNNSALQPLSRMLYLESWDCFVSASFRGAPPVCYHCRKSGHIKKDCPTLRKIKCFKCLEFGHTSRFCRSKTVAIEPLEVKMTIMDTASMSAESDSADDAIEEVANSEPMNEDVEEFSSIGGDMVVNTVELQSEESTVDSHNINNDEFMNVITEEADEQMWETEKTIQVEDNFEAVKELGGLASKYAPVEERLTMDVDTPKPAKKAKKNKKAPVVYNAENPRRSERLSAAKIMNASVIDEIMMPVHTEQLTFIDPSQQGI